MEYCHNLIVAVEQLVDHLLVELVAYQQNPDDHRSVEQMVEVVVTLKVVDALTSLQIKKQQKLKKRNQKNKNLIHLFYIGGGISTFFNTIFLRRCI